MGEKNWNHTKNTIKIIDGEEFSITSGVIDVNIDHKSMPKHLCVSIGSTRLPTEILLKAHEFFKVNYTFKKSGKKMCKVYGYRNNTFF